MSSTTDLKVAPCSEVIERELERARVELRPISRRALREVLIKELRLPAKDAEIAVDSYCEERAPYTPDYLSNEFLLPYIKLAGLVFGIVALGLIAWGADLWERHMPNSWPFFVAGAILFTLSAIGLLKALRYEREGMR
ncbi:MAG TPA: hypothetical protein VKT78_00740 [Fimbriimonadaceae bacterium]|nr:hypothetical protein [Fimbriimonadaceae bacterium]